MVGMEGQPGPELPASCPCPVSQSHAFPIDRAGTSSLPQRPPGGTRRGPPEGVALGPWEAEGAGRPERGHSAQLVRAMGEPAVPTQSSEAAPAPWHRVSWSLNTEHLDLKNITYRWVLVALSVTVLCPEAGCMKRALMLYFRELCRPSGVCFVLFQ